MATNILAGMQYMQQQGELGRQQGLERRYNRLAGEAFNAPTTQARDAAIGQIATNNPDAATKLRADYQAQDDDRTKRLVGAARYMANALKTGSAPAIQGAWSYIRPGLIRAGLATEQELSPEWQADYEPTLHQVLAMGEGAGMANAGAVQSTRIGADGYYYTVDRSGRWTNSGIKADPKTQLRDQPGIEPGLVDLRSGTVSPLQAGGHAPAAPTRDDMEADIALANDMIAAGIPDDQIDAFIIARGRRADALPQAAQQSNLTAPRRDPSQAITPYQQAQLDAQRERSDAARQARDDAAAARAAAEEAKAEQKRQAASVRQAEAATSANSLIAAIDRLQASPGYRQLGTIYGGGMSHVPFTDARDAQSQLDNIAGQVALATMSRLKALSSQGATGFGALSEKELGLLQNSLATLKPGISHQQLEASLKVIRDAMEKTANWRAPQAAAPAQVRTAPVAPAASAQPAAAADPLGIL